MMGKEYRKIRYGIVDRVTRERGEFTDESKVEKRNQLLKME
jgi:hypothetical protein